MMNTLSPEELAALAQDCLTRAGTPEAVAACVAAEVLAAEQAGVREAGLVALRGDLEAIRLGHLDPLAQPTLTTPAAAVVAVDAGTGFAAPALDAAFAPLRDMLDAHPIAMLRLTAATPPAGIFALASAAWTAGVGLFGLRPDGTALPGGIGPGQAAATDGVAAMIAGLAEPPADTYAPRDPTAPPAPTETWIIAARTDTLGPTAPPPAARLTSIPVDSTLLAALINT